MQNHIKLNDAQVEGRRKSDAKKRPLRQSVLKEVCPVRGWQLVLDILLGSNGAVKGMWADLDERCLMSRRSNKPSFEEMLLYSQQCCPPEGHIFLPSVH